LVCRFGLGGAAAAAAFPVSASDSASLDVAFTFLVRFCIFFSICSIGAEGATSETAAESRASGSGDFADSATFIVVTFLSFGFDFKVVADDDAEVDSLICRSLRSSTMCAAIAGFDATSIGRDAFAIFSSAMDSIVTSPGSEEAASAR